MFIHDGDDDGYNDDGNNGDDDDGCDDDGGCSSDDKCTVVMKIYMYGTGNIEK